MKTNTGPSLFSADLDFPLKLSCYVADIERRAKTVLRPTSTVAEAIDDMKSFGGQTVVSTTDAEGHRIASLQIIKAKSLLQALLNLLSDHTKTLTDFFAVPMATLETQRPSMIYPDMTLIGAAERMYLQRNDLLLVSEGIRLGGFISAVDFFDVMIGTAVLDNALFNTQSNAAAPDRIVQTARVCCFQQKVEYIYDTTPLYYLSCDNTILTALRVLMNQPNGHVILSDTQGQCCRLITSSMLLIELLKKYRQQELGEATENLNAVLMKPLDALLDPKKWLLNENCTVLHALETIYFNNQSSVAVISSPTRCKGVVTTESMLKAFLDSMGTAFGAAMMQPELQQGDTSRMMDSPNARGSDARPMPH